MRCNGGRHCKGKGCAELHCCEVNKDISCPCRLRKQSGVGNSGSDDQTAQDRLERVMACVEVSTSAKKRQRSPRSAKNWVRYGGTEIWGRVGGDDEDILGSAP